ncbi:MAG: hypothetical protein GY708_03810, partial [Actinomycetia bacterium]|nr:hypothetical protein [Actinomycetes bacterium]
EGVKIGFGGVVSSVLQPILEHVGPIVDKIGVVNDLLNAPIPVLDDLIDPDPTVLSILGLASEFAPPDYQAVVRFLEASSLIVDIVDMFDTDGEDVVLDLGGFNLLGNGDLRELSDVSLSQLATPTFEGLPFNPLGEGLDIGGIQEALAEHVSPEIAAAVGELASRFEDPVQLNIPFLTDPTGSVFSLLMGHDVDFFRVDVAYQGSAGFKPDVSVPGFSFSFGNTLDYDVEAGLGLDTRGIRNFIQSVADGSPTASHFGEGFYITEGTHVRLEAGLSAELSANLVFVHGGIDGGIEGFLEVRPEPSDEWEDPSPYEDDKLYIRTDLGPCLG